jgi:hypothetical protein
LRPEVSIACSKGDDADADHMQVIDTDSCVRLTVQPARNTLATRRKTKFEIPMLGNGYALRAISDRTLSEQCRGNDPTEVTGWSAYALFVRSPS